MAVAITAIETRADRRRRSLPIGARSDTVIAGWGGAMTSCSHTYTSSGHVAELPLRGWQNESGCVRAASKQRRRDQVGRGPRGQKRVSSLRTTPSSPSVPRQNPLGYWADPAGRRSPSTPVASD